MTTTAQSVRTVALPSEEIIPAVEGEFYAYASEFSVARPLYFLMKCKSNKARPVTTELEPLLRELDLTFVFDNDVCLCSPNSAQSVALLSGVVKGADVSRLNETEIRLTSVPGPRFFRYQEARNGLMLADAFRSAGVSQSAVRLQEGMTLSIRTASNKYGLILVRDVSATSCTLEACHILL